ncbi:MAG: hypothetical protein VX044_01695 [Planctomycetota bacterium]|nr:hypothetical protein [Planctomycetota bacterium]
MTLRSLGLAATLGSSLCAQGPTFVSTLKPLFDLRATQVPRLLENGEVPDTYGAYGTTLPIDQLPAGDEKKR